MAKIIQFPQAPRRVSRLVDEILDTRLTHHNPEVLRCLKEEMRELVEKYFTGEEFTATLMLPPDLSEDQFRFIEDNFRRIFQEHNDRMVTRANRMFLDLCLSRMTVCELRVQHKDTDRP